MRDLTFDEINTATLRDQFAMDALTGLMAHGEVMGASAAFLSYDYADLMMEARKPVNPLPAGEADRQRRLEARRASGVRRMTHLAKPGFAKPFQHRTACGIAVPTARVVEGSPECPVCFDIYLQQLVDGEAELAVLLESK